MCLVIPLSVLSNSTLSAAQLLEVAEGLLKLLLQGLIALYVGHIHFE